jgi:predicted dithiol-disulfide oxidoreductase (DUF899 family)
MSCAGRVDQYGNTAHLHERDTTIAVVSRAPIEKIARWKHKMGWTFPSYSSHGSRFNFDYGVSFDDTVEDPRYNYRSTAELRPSTDGPSSLVSCTERVCSFASAIASSTPTRPTGAGPSRLAAPLLPRHDGPWPPGG